jgi:excisionase family DNA binding protein
MSQKETLSIPEAARLMNVATLDYIYKLIWAGGLRAEKVNGRWRIEKASVLEHIGRVSAKRNSRSFSGEPEFERPAWLTR